MKTELQIDLTYEQVLAIVKQLPRQEKIKLGRELEKEAIHTKLTGLLRIFETDELSEDIINEEAETVRKQFYENREH